MLSASFSVLPGGISWTTIAFLSAPFLFIVVLYGSMLLEDRGWRLRRAHRRRNRRWRRNGETLDLTAVPLVSEESPGAIREAIRRRARRGQS